MSQRRSVEPMLRELELLHHRNRLQPADALYMSPDNELQSSNIFYNVENNIENESEKKTISFKSHSQLILENDLSQDGQLDDSDDRNTNRILLIQKELQKIKNDIHNSRIKSITDSFLRFATQQNSTDSAPRSSKIQIKVGHSIKRIDSYLNISGQQTNGNNNSSTFLENQISQNVIAQNKIPQEGKISALGGKDKSEKNYSNGPKTQVNLEQAIKYSSDIKIMQLKLQGHSSNDWYQKLTRGR